MTPDPTTKTESRPDIAAADAAVKETYNPPPEAKPLNQDALGKMPQHVVRFRAFAHERLVQPFPPDVRIWFVNNGPKPEERGSKPYGVYTAIVRAHSVPEAEAKVTRCWKQCEVVRTTSKAHDWEPGAAFPGQRVN